jgi:ketosteroid isomerase-like protein
MTSEEQRNLKLVRRYFAAMARGPAGVELAAFFTPDVVQEEFPNRLLPHGAKRDLQGMREAAERGRGIMAHQTIELVSAVASGSHVAVEARWTGTLARMAGSIPEGTTLHARFGVFFDFRDGKIAAQRNYDCFDPW